MKGEGMFRCVETLGPGSFSFNCLHHVWPVETEPCWEARVGWERPGLFTFPFSVSRWGCETENPFLDWELL